MAEAEEGWALARAAVTWTAAMAAAEDSWAAAERFGTKAEPLGAATELAKRAV